MPREDAFLRDNRYELDEQNLMTGVAVREAVLEQTEKVSIHFSL